MKKNIFSFLAFFTLVYILRLFSLNTALVENIYSRKVYKFISSSVIKITEIVPFSLAEIVLFAFIIFVILFILQYFNLYINFVKKNVLIAFSYTIYFTLLTTFIVYIVFMCIWGLNYYRKPLISYYKDSKVEEIHVIELASILIKNANELKQEIKNKYLDEKDFSHLNNVVYDDFKSVFAEYPFLETYYSRTKPIFISKFFTRMEITGIFAPFTYEANVNVSIPVISAPFTIAHEISHQIGIAFEDEANFIAYIVCEKSDNIEVKYSGTFEALLYTLNSLKKNTEVYDKLIASLSEDVKNDIKKYYEFWSTYENTPISNAATKVNDTYLKANNQADGVQSYSRVVKLITLYTLKNDKEDM